MKKETNLCLTQLLDPFQNSTCFSKTYSESPLHGDVKNCITVEFSCRNDGEIRCWGGCKYPTFRWKKWKKSVLKLNFYTCYKTQNLFFKPYLENSIHVDLKMV